MSIAVTIATPAGIVMTADTLVLASAAPNATGRKLHLTRGRVGVSVTFDLPRQTADALQLDAFLEELNEPNAERTAAALQAHLQRHPLAGADRVAAHVASVQGDSLDTWAVDTRHGLAPLGLTHERCGIAWHGEPNTLTRLLQPVERALASGERTPVRHAPIDWRTVTLPEALEFAVFAIDATAMMLRYQGTPNAGGQVDALTLTPAWASSGSYRIERLAPGHLAPHDPWGEGVSA